MSSVQSIVRAFAVLTALSDGPIGVTAIAERARLPKSTVVRLLRTLQAEDAVEQVADDGRYRLGPRLGILAASLVPSRSLVAIARPHLAELAEAVGEAAGLAVLEGREVLYVDQVDTPKPVAVRDWTGTRVVLHAVPSGQVFLAAMAPAALERYLTGELEAYTERTLTDPGALRARLARVAADGVAWVRDEFMEGISSVAAPVRAAAGEVVAAVHVHGPSYRFPAEGSEAWIARRVVTAAGRIAAATSREDR